jgi:Flp pilus assembly protein TadG
MKRGREYREHGERGTVAVFTVIFAIFVIVMAGLLVDGGDAIDARSRAGQIAQEGARATANDIDIGYLRQTGKVRIVGQAACARAADLIAAYPEVNMAPVCHVIDGGDTARVTVTITVRLKLLSIIPSFHQFTVSATADAHPQAGV